MAPQDPTGWALPQCNAGVFLVRLDTSHARAPCWPVRILIFFPSRNMAGFMLHSVPQIVVVPKVSLSIYQNDEHIVVAVPKSSAHFVCIQVSPLNPSSWQTSRKTFD